MRPVHPDAGARTGNLTHVTRSATSGHEHPWRQYLIVLVALAAALGGLMHQCSRRPIAHPPGQLAPLEPRQHALEGTDAFEFKGYALTPRAVFELEARILSTVRYRFDPGAPLAPYDFALGWGPMSDTAVLEQLEITQGSRFYTVYPQAPELDLPTLMRHSSNMHLIPASEAVERLLASARVGHVVGIAGSLVDAKRADGYAWRTSLTRADTGAGACELVFVERAWLR
jgi:hypothetical protein